MSSKKTENHGRTPQKKYSVKPSEKNGSRSHKKEREPQSSSSLFNQILPYIFYVTAFFLAICFFLIDALDKPDAMGIVGKLLNAIFCGSFGYGAFLIPVLLVYLGIIWRASIDEGQARYKISFSIACVLLISALFHIFAIGPDGKNAIAYTFNPISLWNGGIDLLSGGLVGGYLGGFSFVGLRFVGSLIVLIALILISFMFLFGMTPDNIAIYIKYKIKTRRERREEMGERESRRPRFTPKDPEDIADSAEQSASRRKKRVFDVMVDEGGEEDAPTPEDLGLEFTDTNQIPYDENQAEIDNNTPPFDLGDTDSGDFGDDLDSIFAPENNGVSLSEGADDEQMPIRASSDDDFLRVTSEARSDIPPIDKAIPFGEQIRAEIYPPISILKEDKNNKTENFTAELRQTAEKLQETLLSFNVKTKIVGYSRGPTVTRYELQPEAGTRVRSIANLVDDIALNLAATGIRIEAPIPGKSAVGIEVPNRTASTVFLRSLIESPKFKEGQSKITACLGADVAGSPVIFDVAKMPHLLIAGATGMGKSVCINSIIISLLYKALPRDVRLLLIDPKKVEFNIYKDIPHLIAPIVCDPKKSAGALIKMVEEMERRFALIEEVGVRDLKSYNEITKDDPDYEHLPQIVIIIDELADLMMTTPQDVENSICRLAQKARAAGMHIIIGTQRPSVDVITGLIKANIPSRIAFTVASQVDSRTIIDIAGAEKLIGRGDMLYAPVGAAKPIRVQGAFVSDSEVEEVCEFIKANTGKAEYDSTIVSGIEEAAARLDAPKKGGGAMSGGDSGGDDGGDAMLRPAIELAIECGKISTSLIQRRLSLGYGRAAKLIDKMEQLGYVGPQDGQKPREVLITKQAYMEMVVNNDIQ